MRKIRHCNANSMNSDGNAQNHLYPHKHKYIHTRTYTNTHTNPYTTTYTHAHTQTHTNTHTHTNAHAKSSVHLRPESTTQVTHKRKNVIFYISAQQVEEQTLSSCSGLSGFVCGSSGAGDAGGGSSVFACLGFDASFFGASFSGAALRFARPLSFSSRSADDGLSCSGCDEHFTVWDLNNK